MDTEKFLSEFTKITSSIGENEVTIQQIVDTYKLLEEFGVTIDIEYVLNTYGKTFSDLPKELQNKIKNDKKNYRLY